MDEQKKTWKKPDGSDVAIEPWAWSVGYGLKDGQPDEIHQFEADGTFHPFTDVDQERAEVLIMHRTDDPRIRYDLYVKKGRAQLFHFYRRQKWRVGTAYECESVVYVFGWKDRETGKCAYHYILPSGNLVIAADHDFEHVAAIVEAELGLLQKDAEAAAATEIEKAAV